MKKQKAELDRQTTYLTLLPDMAEGFHSGYQARAGIVSDGNQKPHEWLESVARNMLTQGEDVGYSIPDAMAGEQQLRRLMRLPYEDAMRHQEMIDWRAVLALLLLWDSWPKDGAWPTLGFEDALAGDAAFTQTVRNAIGPERAAAGLPLYTLSGQRDHVPEQRPLCLLSRATVLTPAADLGDLGAVLPDRVRWYDRENKRFSDPCGFLEESERARLTQGLRLLQALNAQSALCSPLYSPDAPVCAVIDRFLEDLAQPREAWRAAVERGESVAVRSLQLRALAVYGLWENRVSTLFTCERRELSAESLRQNPLIARVLPEGAPLPVEDLTQIEYRIAGVGFARESEPYLLEPTLAPGESAALEQARKELSLPSAYSAEWNHAVGARFAELAREREGQAGRSARVTALLAQWGAERLAYRESAEKLVTLYYPIDGAPDTLSALLHQLLGLPVGEPIADAFSDRLLLCEGACPFAESALAEHTRAGEHWFAVPPLSPWLARWLADAGDAAPENEAESERPRLSVQGLAFEPIQDAQGEGVRARFRIERRRRAEDALLANAVQFERVYRTPEIVRLPTAALPTVAVWPNVRLAQGAWTAYYVYAHRPEAVDLWIEDNGAWTQGAFRRAADPHLGERRWQIARVERFPAFVVLKKGTVSLGVLPNDLPRTQLKREAPAVAALDFGSIATTVMLGQEERVRPATLPEGLTGPLLIADPNDARFLCDELLPLDALCDRGPQPSTFRSVMDLFSDNEQGWRVPLCDGHVYYAPNLRALLEKNANTLYYDLKWGEQDYALACLRLFLSQVMLQSALSARLCGSPSISWRASMPNALPLYRQEAYLALLRALAKETSDKCGLPLTPGVPAVLYATENQADGLYFRSRNEVNAHGGYLNLDVGGGTSDLSLWLGNAARAALESSLRLGCRQMLYETLAERRLAEFTADFAEADPALQAAVESMTSSFAATGAAVHSQQKNRLLLDEFFAEHSLPCAETMAQARAEGRVSLLESVLLLHFAFLFRLCGAMLDRAMDDIDAQPRLGARIELCVAGNGGQFLKSFDADARAKLCRMALGALRPDHPVRELVLRQSMNPKQEVAIGLLCDEQQLRSTVQGDVAAVRAQAAAPARDFLPGFLNAFYAAFPQAAERLLGPMFEKGASANAVLLRPEAEIELGAVLDNELAGACEDELAAQVRCFAAMKRLWHI